MRRRLGKWGKVCCVHLLDLESALPDERRYVAGHVAAIECPLKKRSVRSCQRRTGRSGESPCSKKMNCPLGFRTRPIPRMASTTPGIVHNVKVLTTVSTLPSAKG